MKRLAFSDPMMMALASGEKTMTRRIERATNRNAIVDSDGKPQRSRLKLGDLVAATCAYSTGYDLYGDWTAYKYQISAEDLPTLNADWKPASIMPAALAPFVLRIMEVRAERLGEITDADAMREGMGHWGSRTLVTIGPHAPRDVFGIYWNQLYGQHPLRDVWTRDQNLWVWVYNFEIADRRI